MTSTITDTNTDIDTPTEISVAETPHKMSHFWLKLALFLIPVALPVLLLTGSMIFMGESMPLAMVVTLQSGDTPVLYRPQYGNRDLPFKALSVNTRKPQVVAVGSSRVLQLRGGLFDKNPRAFYNAGAPAWKIPQIREFLDSLTHTPDVLILGIDAPWFNDAYEGDTFAPYLNDFQQLFSVNRGVMQDWMLGIGQDWGEILARRDPEYGGLALGMRAIENGHGFRNDGSEKYGDFLVAEFLWQPRERERHLEWVREGTKMYVHGDTVSESALREWAEILDWAKTRGVDVIGFMPPFAPATYDEILALGKHTYIPQLIPRLQALFVERGMSFFDFYDGQNFGADEDFYDGWHGSEWVYLRQYIVMRDTLPQILGEYSDLDHLRAIDASVTDTWRVFVP